MSASNVNCKISEDAVAKQDMSKLIEVIETCTPLWNFKLSLGERSIKVAVTVTVTVSEIWLHRRNITA